MKKKVGKLLYAITIMMLMLVVVVGCNSANKTNQDTTSSPNTTTTEPGKVTDSEVKEDIELRFSWWGSQDRHDRTLQAIELYEQQNPHVTISPEFAGFAGYWEKIATQAAGGNLPDIIQQEKGYLADYTNRGLMENLDPYVQSGSLNLSDVDDLYLHDGKLNGSLYAVNFGSNALATAVDPAMYEQAGVPLPQPGQTWQEFMEEARKLKAGLGDGVYIDAHTDRDGFEFYLRGNGQKLYNAEGTALGFEQQYLIDFYTMMKTLVDEGVLTPPDVVASIQGLEDELIVHQKAPNVAFWSNQIIAVSRAANRPLELVLVPIVENEGDNKSYIVKASQYLSISSNSKHKEEAAKFIDFLTNSLEANDLLEAERGIPISAKVREHLYPKLNPISQEMFDFVEAATPYAGLWSLGPPGEGAIAKAFDRNYEKIVYGKATPEEAASTFMNEANELLKR